MEVVLRSRQHEAEGGGAERAHRVYGPAGHEEQPLETPVAWGRRFCLDLFEKNDVLMRHDGISYVIFFTRIHALDLQQEQYSAD